MSANNPGTKLAEEIFEDLRKQILSGALLPGEKLSSERELAAEYKTNRNTLREAIRKLEQERLVMVRHGQGVTVQDFRRSCTIDVIGAFMEYGADPRERGRVLLDLLPARANVIEFTTVLAIDRCTDTDISMLSEIAANTLSAFERQDWPRVVIGFRDWLEAVVDASHSLLFRWIANPLFQAERDLFQRMPSLWIPEPGLPIYLKTLVKAFEDGDVTSAQSATRIYFQEVDQKLTGLVRDALGVMPAGVSAVLPPEKANGSRRKSSL
jgi:GntR family transcriptional regulator, transcriptional repressor for pyruvate dehydrogenase complex